MWQVEQIFASVDWDEIPRHSALGRLYQGSMAYEDGVSNMMHLVYGVSGLNLNSVYDRIRDNPEIQEYLEESGVDVDAFLADYDRDALSDYSDPEMQDRDDSDRDDDDDGGTDRSDDERSEGSQYSAEEDPGHEDLTEYEIIQREQQEKAAYDAEQDEMQRSIEETRSGNAWV